MAEVRKIPSAEWRERYKKSDDQQCRLLKEYPKMKCKVKGEKGYRIDLDVWEKILKQA